MELIVGLILILIEEIARLLEEGEVGCLIWMILPFIIYGTVKYWYIMKYFWAIGFVIVIVISAVSKIKEWKEEKERQKQWQIEEEERQKQRQIEEELKRKEKHRRQQEAYRNEMIALGAQATDLFNLLLRYLNDAEGWLNQAKVDFADRAFAPFWDSIENAAICLAYFSESVPQIQNNITRYTQLIRWYEDTPPQYPLAPQSIIEKLAASKAIAERLQAIVRKAQRDYQFATIYEQRKTNQILVAGFTTLAQALQQMTQHITASIDNLAGSVDGMTSTLNESMRAIHSRMDGIAEMGSQHHEEISKD